MDVLVWSSISYPSERLKIRNYPSRSYMDYLRRGKMEFIKSTLQFIDSVLLLNIERSTEDIMQSVIGFLQPYFAVSQGHGEGSFATLTVLPFDHFDRENPSEKSYKPLVIRKSSAALFNLSGKVAVVGGVETVVYDGLDTAFKFRKSKREIHLYVSDRSWIAVVELIRDLTIKSEEQKGSLVLHASSIELNGRAIALVGAKGQGKSTVLLDLVINQGFGFISGDKLFVRTENDKVFVYGWPDYPHLGCGTILQHPALYAYLVGAGYEIDAQDLARKILIEPSHFIDALGIDFISGPQSLEAVVFPSFDRSNHPSLSTIEESNHATILECLEFSVENPFSAWHGFLPLTGAGHMSEEITKFTSAISHSRFFNVSALGQIGSHFSERVL